MTIHLEATIPAAPESPAAAVARAHVEAWSNHDFDTARNGHASDVRVTAVTTQPMPPATDLTGADDQADFGAGEVTLPGARLYLLDDNNKIKTEHVIFYAAQN